MAGAAMGARCRAIEPTDSVEQYAERRFNSPKNEYVIVSGQATLAVVLRIAARDGWHVLSTASHLIIYRARRK